MHENQEVVHALHVLQHYLPSQAPLKDFIHHNTLHAFQSAHFNDALQAAHSLFGYQTNLPLATYRDLYREGQISEKVLDAVLKKSDSNIHKTDLIEAEFDESVYPLVGSLRTAWKDKIGYDLDTRVHPTLFRLTSSFLDQGIAIWPFPTADLDFLSALRKLETQGSSSIFNGKRARQLFLNEKTTLLTLLDLLLADRKLITCYLLDQQFAHPGYSGMVAHIEQNPDALVKRRKIQLLDFIFLECLLEIDALDQHYHTAWQPIGLLALPVYEFDPQQIEKSELFALKSIWQEAYEWTFYDQVLSGLVLKQTKTEESYTAQGIFCIDDRECSIRRHIELMHPAFESFGSPGHFNVETYFQPEGSAQRTKICPAPLHPRHLIKEKSIEKQQNREWHFSNHSYGLILGWILTHSYGFWSALKLALSIFKPSLNKMAVSSQQHMHPESILSIAFENETTPDGLQVGFTIEEMTQIVFSQLNSIGLINNFAPLIYLVAHGSSSANNTHYAGYDCGACSGRPGSVNSRAFAYMANHPLVREKLLAMGISIPTATHFVPLLHDTSRDEFIYYDTAQMSVSHLDLFHCDRQIFAKALELNATERSRKFITMDSSIATQKVHQHVKLRSVSLFEPRPELNHANNCLCIVGRRSFSQNLFLDRRAFLNSYDYRNDPDAIYLEGILNAVAPVCGGINLEYYFSRVDNQQLGAGTKLPHNVMGLIGVANGIDGDLRTGLPSQMIEVHDPYRLLVVVEQTPQKVLEAIKRRPQTWEWFKNEWVRLVAYDPELEALWLLENGDFRPYELIDPRLSQTQNLLDLIKNSPANYPVVELQSKAS